MPQTISWADFEKVDVRVGTIVAAEPFPEARKPAFKIHVDFGAGIGVKHTSAQITVNYDLAELTGRQVLGVVNFPPKQIGPFISEFLLLGLPDENGNVVMLMPERDVPNGGRMF